MNEAAEFLVQVLAALLLALVAFVFGLLILGLSDVSAAGVLLLLVGTLALGFAVYKVVYRPAGIW